MRELLIYFFHYDFSQQCSLFMYFYSLYNYKKLDPKGDLTYDNLALVRTFAGSESE
jgi:indoleamine 2,3-dioxygenase